MPTLQEETVSIPPPGRWDWNDDTQTLEFIPFNTSEKNKRRKTSRSSSYQEHFRKHLERISQSQTLVNGGNTCLRKIATLAELNSYMSAVKNSQSDLVTIEDIKQVAVYLMHEKEGLPIPICFLTVIKSGDVDKFLIGLLLYLYYHWQMTALTEQPKSAMVVQGMKERQMMAVASAKVELARKYLGFCYSHLVMGIDLGKHHHMACGSVPINSEEFRSGNYEEVPDSQHSLIFFALPICIACLYSFFCYVAWVTFKRQNLKGIQAEIGTLMRSDIFNPALTASENNDEKEQNIIQNERQLETEKTTRTIQKNRRSHSRSSLSCMLTQRSPLLVSFLPSTREQAPHLFQRSDLPKQETDQLINTDALMEELNQQLASCSFGILGMSLSKFDNDLLIVHETKNEDEESDEDRDNYENERLEENVKGRKSSIKHQRSTTTAARRCSSLSRSHSVTSRSTTEASFSDTD